MFVNAQRRGRLTSLKSLLYITHPYFLHSFTVQMCLINLRRNLIEDMLSHKESLKEDLVLLRNSKLSYHQRSSVKDQVDAQVCASPSKSLFCTCKIEDTCNNH